MNFLNYDVFDCMSLKMVLILAKRAFYLGLHCQSTGLGVSSIGLFFEIHVCTAVI